MTQAVTGALTERLRQLPYLLIVRVLIAAGIWLRFAYHETSVIPPGLVGIPALLLSVTLVGALLLMARPNATWARHGWAAVTLLDVVTITVCYWQTGGPESDFFLFYYLPIIVAAEYVGGRFSIIAFVFSTIAFAAVVFSLNTIQPSPRPVADLIFRVFLPREVFFIAVTLIYALRLRSEREARELAATHKSQMQGLLSLKERLDELVTLPEILEQAIDRAVLALGAARVVCVIRPADSSDGRYVTAHSGTAQEPTRDELLLAECERTASGLSEPGVVPIVVTGRTIGALAAQYEQASPENAVDYLYALSEQIGAAWERIRLFSIFRRIGSASATVVELNEQLESMLDETERLGFEFATISLVDDYMGHIRAVRGRNVPPGWITRAVHKLTDKDIQADVVRQKEAVVIDRWDARLDWDLWERFNHERLARVFAPIIHDGKAIGTIEAGCDRTREDRVITKQNIATVIQLGRDKGSIIAASVPSVLLELVALAAIELTGVDSSSVHVFDGDTPLLAAAAGRADREFVNKFPPSRNGLGWRAIHLRTPQVENELPPSKRELASLGICAMAAIPLSLGANVRGVIYIHYWRTKRITNTELELVSVLVPQIELAIQNFLLLRNISEADEEASKVTGLQDMIRALSSNLELDRLLNELAANALYMLDAKNVTLYQYFQQERRFTPAVMKGRFERPDLMRMEVRPDDIVARVIADGESRFFPDAENAPFLKEPRTDQIPQVRFVEREGIKSCAILVLRSLYDDEIVGCLFVNYVDRQDFDHRFQSLANSLASSAALAIKVGRLHVSDIERNTRDVQRARREIDALRAFSRTLVQSDHEPNLKTLCEQLLTHAFSVLDADVGDVTLWNPINQKLKVIAYKGYPAGLPEVDVALGYGIVGRVGATHRAERVDDVRGNEHYRELNPQTRSELAVPMLDDDKLLGVINIEHPVPNTFGERDELFLDTLAVQGVIAIHSVNLYNKLERQLQQALSLSTIAAYTQDAQDDINTVVRLLLIGVTAGQGLAFSRGMLFLVDEDRQELVGADAIGAVTREEAEARWRELDQEEQRRAPEGFLEWLLAAAKIQVSGPMAERHDTPLRRLVRRTAMSVESPRGVVALCFGNGMRKVHTIQSGQDDPLRDALAAAYDHTTDCAIACVPIKTRERLIALLVLDNRFLFEERFIDPICEPTLAAFAELSAITIDSARLKDRLADERQLAEWRSTTDRVAHRFKTRFKPVQAKVVEVATALNDRDITKARTAVQEMGDLVEQTAVLLRDFERFSARSPIITTQVDVIGTLRRLVTEFRTSLRCEIELDAPIEPIIVEADAQRLPDVFIDLFLNADRAMRGAGVADPRLLLAVRIENGGVAIDVVDNGPGVPHEIQSRLFSPWITAANSSGLGLAIIRDLVEQHDGTIVYAAGPNGIGAQFTIWFPVVAAGETAAI